MFLVFCLFIVFVKSLIWSLNQDKFTLMTHYYSTYLDVDMVHILFFNTLTIRFCLTLNESEDLVNQNVYIS